MNGYAKVMVLVPGAVATSTSFNFCIANLGEYSGGGWTGGNPCTRTRRKPMASLKVETGGATRGLSTEIPNAGTSVGPKAFTGTAAGTQLSAQGSVGAAASDVAVLGVNVNQAQQAGPVPAFDYIPTGTGISYTINTTGPTFPFRIQLQDAAGTYWCFNATSNTGTIPYASFNTACGTQRAVPTSIRPQTSMRP